MHDDRELPSEKKMPAGHKYPKSSAKKTPVIPVKLSDVRETDEYEAEAQRIKDMYLDKPYKMKPGNVGPVHSLRERILSMSLFPNIFNKC